MEECGCSLSKYIRANPDIKMEVKTNLAYQVSEAVKFMHGNRWYHGDIKPSNVLLKSKRKEKLVVKLTDLGLSKRLVDSSDQLSSKLDYAALAWIAPELYTPPIRPSAASDIWALGCLIFFLFTWGKHPFDSPEGRSLADRVTNITNKKVNLTALQKQDCNSLLITRLQNMIRSMVNNDPSSRPNAQQVIYHFKFLTTEASKSTQLQTTAAAHSSNSSPVLSAMGILAMLWNYNWFSSESKKGNSSNASESDLVMKTVLNATHDVKKIKPGSKMKNKTTFNGKNINQGKGIKN